MTPKCLFYFIPIALTSAFPFYQPPNPALRNIWPQQPLPQEPAPLYGYPDYGEYGDPRPAYTELDIVREQLARSQPYIKRFPPPLPPDIYPDEEEGFWALDNELSPEIVNNPALETLTEALLEAIMRQGEQQNNYLPQEEVDSDEMVRELKETAVKKSEKKSVVTQAPTEEASTIGKEPDGGQKEIPLMRPAVSRTKSPSAPSDGGMKRNSSAQSEINLSRFNGRRQMSPFVSNIEDLTEELNSLKKIVE